MQEGSESTAGKFIHSYSGILIMGHFPFPHQGFPCPNLPSRAHFPVPPWMDDCTAFCFINTLAPLFLYSLCLIVGEGECLDILHSLEFTFNIQILKEPPNYISTIRLFKDGLSSAFPSFQPSKKLWSPLLPLGFHVFLAWQGPESRIVFIILRQGKHNVL